MGEKNYVQIDPETGYITATLSVYADDAEERDVVYRELVSERGQDNVEVASVADLPDAATERWQDGNFVDRDD